MKPMCPNFIMFWPKGKRLAYSSTNLPNLSIIFTSFLHNISYTTWTTPSLNCKHPHWPYGYPPLMLCSWQWTHWNLCCNSQHLYYHCVRCWFPRGTRIIICIFFNHIQLLSLTNQHWSYQRWHLHLSRCCHYWPNANKLTSLILCNSRICCLGCSSSQGKELSQLTPQWSIPPLSNCGIWLFTQTCRCVSTWLC
jgi:hypothetical protein